MALNNGLHDEILILAKKHHSTTSSSTSSPPPSPISIYNIPHTLRMVKPRAYRPRVISFGLIHRLTTEKIISMDELKEVYMSSLFQRTIPHETTPNGLNLDETVRLCVDSMITMADAANKSYPVKSRCSDTDVTARVMLLDGCFIIELLIKCCCDGISSADDITSNRFRLGNIKHDILLLENQLPFFILEELYAHTVGRFNLYHPSIPPLKELILEFFGNKLNSNFKLKIRCDSRSESVVVDHILGLLHSCYQPGESNPGDYQISKYSATELHRSGVNIKPSKGNTEVYLHVDFKTPCLFSWFVSIYDTTTQLLPVSKKAKKIRCCVLSFMCQFCCRATLEIPELCVTDSTESFMKNLIAYEQCSQHIPRYITSYAFLMDTLINSKEHVELLETSGVLKNYLGSGEDASNLFNSLCKEVDLGDFYFSKQWAEMDAYYRLYWPSCIASLRRTYFGNPWTSISVFAALILFAFTGLQTICTVISTW
jgi:hypothetical protein